MSKSSKTFLFDIARFVERPRFRSSGTTRSTSSSAPLAVSPTVGQERNRSIATPLVVLNPALLMRSGAVLRQHRLDFIGGKASSLAGARPRAINRLDGGQAGGSPETMTGGMFSYISAEQQAPHDHPLRAIRAMVDAALRNHGAA